MNDSKMRRVMEFLVIAVGIRFLLDGVALGSMLGSISASHMDPLTYAAVLTPVFGAHGVREFMNGKKESEESKDEQA